MASMVQPFFTTFGVHTDHVEIRGFSYCVVQRLMFPAPKLGGCSPVVPTVAVVTCPDLGLFSMLHPASQPLRGSTWVVAIVVEFLGVVKQCLGVG